MATKQEALDKAREQGKIAKEGGKEFGKQGWKAIKKTAGALGHTLVAGYEAGASKISKSRENKEGISEEEKKKHGKAKKLYSDKANSHLQKAKDSGKEAGSGAWKAAKGGGRAFIHGVVAGYHRIDAGDKAIGEKIEEKNKEKGKNNSSKIGKFFRNNIMKSSIALALLGYGGTEAVQHINNSKQPGKEIQHNEEGKGDSNVITLVPTQGYEVLKRKPITTNAPLTRWYLGGDLENSGNLVIGDTLVLNSAESLHNLWSKKIRKYGQSTKNINDLDTVNVKGMSPEEIESFRVKYPIDATYLLVVKPYTDGNEKKETMGLKEFIKQSNQLVETLKSDTEVYDGGLKGSKKDLFDAIRRDITGECIVAYAMTELCENKENGEFNKQLFDLLLKNSGVNYLSNVPAIYDNKTSYGLYQFTEYALYDRDGEKRGASLVNQYLPKDKKIPGSVIDLKSWQDQTKAAYMFALYNLNSAVSKLSDEQAKSLLNYQKNNKENFRDNITQLIAMCHHMPVDSGALKKWHENKHKQDIYHYGKAQTYGKASKNNYESLKK